MTNTAQTVTLVLTDVVDSTKLAAALGTEKNAALWDEHDRVARELVAAWHGREVERTDGILAVFEQPEPAFAFARAYVAALRRIEPPLVARVGVHRGPLVIRENPAQHVSRGAKPLEADGLSLSVTARVAAIAGGRQILLTSAAAGLEAPPLETRGFKSHGHWRLKGAPEPIEIFELDHDDAPGGPPADGEKAYRVIREGDLWLPARTIPNALPAEQDRFVGRHPDLDAIARLFLDGARLVSVAGIGGTGKTRLVTRFAWSYLGDYPGGAWFCDLSDARDIDGIVRAVAVSLDVRLDTADPIDQLTQAIVDRGRGLVVLDNFEQVAELAPHTLGGWLSAAPEASFLVTTRERLGLPGEVTFSLPPLKEEDAIALFAERATAANPDFRLTPEVKDDIRALVHRLDYLPLAIELAAPRIRAMSTAALLARLNERFDLLASNRGRTGRQGTLRAALDWSWDLLEPEEQSAWAQTSVFEGGFTLDAAEAVLTAADGPVVDTMQDLVDRSLVRRVAEDRFDLLTIVKAYAAGRLDTIGQRPDVESRHGRYYAGLGAQFDDGNPPARELENIVSACRRAVGRADADTALVTLKTAWAITDRQGPASLAAALASEVGELPGLAAGLRDRLRAEALLAQGSHVDGQRELRLALSRLGFPEPSTLFGLIGRILSRVLIQVWRRVRGATGRAHGDRDVVMAATRAYQRLVETYWFANEPPRMLGAAISALHLCEPLGPTPERARAYATLALATSGLGLNRTAERYASLALTTAKDTGAVLAEAYVRFLACVYRIGQARWQEVDHDLAIAKALFEQGQDHRLLGDALTVEGMAALYRGDFEGASARFADVLRSGRRHANAQHKVWGALGDAEAMLRRGHLDAAAERMAEAHRVLDSFASPIELARAWGLSARIDFERGRPTDARAAAEQAIERLGRLGAPTAHYLLEGYASAAEVLMLLGTPSKKAARLMKTYADAFPIGRPRWAWLQARQSLTLRRATKARRIAAEGLKTAAKLGMNYERDRLAALDLP